MGLLNLVSRVLNGFPFASYELDALTYRAEPIKQRQSVLIPGIPVETALQVDLQDVLLYNMLVTGVDVDIVEDDEDNFDTGDTVYENSTFVALFVNIIDRKTGVVIKRLNFSISSFPRYQNQIILVPEHLYEFKASKPINSITFTGEPVHVKPPIVFVQGVYKEALTARRGRN